MELKPLHLSFEFFPPKSEAAAAQLTDTVRDLAAWQPDFVSVTCGAGGSAIDGTFAVVKNIRENYGLTVAPHIAFSRLSRAKLGEVVEAYKKLGIRQTVAIRGDAAAVAQAEPPSGEVYADTIEFISDLSRQYKLEPIVAAYPDVHPLAQSPQQDLDYLKRKAEAGSRRAISQFFFEAETFLRFRDRVEKAAIPVTLTPGILPIHNLAQALRFATSCGTRIPAGLKDRFERWGDDPAALLKESVAHAAGLCEELARGGVEDFHFYTLNRSALTNEICSRLGLEKARIPTATTA
jgi:methylenetetrahydrofolate reductase (NADPH)